MNKPDMFTTPSGDRMAILPAEEYERLRAAAEDGEDVRTFDEAKRQLAAGEDELLPAEFAERLVRGEPPLRVFRELRQLSLEELARSAGISPEDLAAIETGKRDGSFALIKKIAAVLGVTLDDLA